jgi:hypothetical protein
VEATAVVAIAFLCPVDEELREVRTLDGTDGKMTVARPVKSANEQHYRN